MPVLWSPEDLAARFAPYIEELHDVFVMHGLHYGSPDDLRRLALDLEKPGSLQEELAALIRSIVLREGGSIPRTDLLEIVAISIAGPRMNPAGEELQQSARQLLAFLHSSLRRPWNEPPGEERLRRPSVEELGTKAEPELRSHSMRAEASRQSPLNRPHTPVGSGASSQQHAEHTKVIPFGRAKAVFSRLARVEGTEFTGEDPAPLEHRVVARIAEPNGEAGGSAEVGLVDDMPEVSITQTVADAEPVDQPQVPAQTMAGEHRQETTPLMAVSSKEPPTVELPVTAFVPAIPETTQPASLTTAVAGSAPAAPSQEVKAAARLPQSAIQPGRRLAWGAAAAALLFVTLAGTLVARSRKSTAAMPSEAGTHAAASTAAAAAESETRLARVIVTADSERTASKPSADVPVRTSMPESAKNEARADDDYVAAPYSRLPVRSVTPAVAPTTVPPPARNVPATSPAVQAASAPELQASNIPAEPVDPRDPDASIVGDLPFGQGFVTSSRLPSHPSLSATVMAANLVSGPEPDYPTLAKLAHVDGAVVLRAEITPGGVVSDTDVISGHHLLRHAAEEAVRRWRFRPYEVDGNPVAVSTTVTVRFRH